MCPLSASPPESFSVVFCFVHAPVSRTLGILRTPRARSIAICRKSFSQSPDRKRSSLCSNAFRRMDSLTTRQQSNPYFFLRKEVIQPHLPIRLPCYDFTPVISPAFGSSLLTVGSLTSGISNSHGVTGGVYKTRERIHRGILIRDY